MPEPGITQFENAAVIGDGNDDGILGLNNRDVGKSIFPAGGIMVYAGASTPTGWLDCDGQAISRITYAGLFSAIGTAYGGGDGSTTFNVPDLRGRFPIGAGSVAGLTSRSRGDTGGAETEALTTQQLPVHSHTGSAESNGSHGHSGSAESNGSHTHSVSGTAGSGGGHRHGYSRASTGYHDVVTSGGNNFVYGGRTDSNTDTGGSHQHSVSGSAGSSGSHSHSVTINSGGAHSHSVSIGNTGNGQAHNNTPPFLGVRFIIRSS